MGVNNNSSKKVSDPVVIDQRKSSQESIKPCGSPEHKKGTPPFRTLLSPKISRNSSEESVPARARTVLQGVEKGVTTMLPQSMAERVEKVSLNVKGSVGG